MLDSPFWHKWKRFYSTIFRCGPFPSPGLFESLRLNPDCTIFLRLRPSQYLLLVLLSDRGRGQLKLPGLFHQDYYHLTFAGQRPVQEHLGLNLLTFLESLLVWSLW